MIQMALSRPQPRTLLILRTRTAWPRRRSSDAARRADLRSGVDGHVAIHALSCWLCVLITVKVSSLCNVLSITILHHFSNRHHRASGSVKELGIRFHSRRSLAGKQLSLLQAWRSYRETRASVVRTGRSRAHSDRIHRRRIPRCSRLCRAKDIQCEHPGGRWSCGGCDSRPCGCCCSNS